VTSWGRHLTGDDKLTSLLGYITHYEGNLLVRRFKRGGQLPGWVESGMAHFYEALLNEHRTLSITRYDGFEDVKVWRPGLETFPEWYAAIAKPEFRETELTPLSALRAKPVEELDAEDLFTAFFMVKWFMEGERQQEFVDYVRLAFLEKYQQRVMTTEQEAFDTVWPEGTERLENEFRDWAAKLPGKPPDSP
jgi:hypothetical protein